MMGGFGRRSLYVRLAFTAVLLIAVLGFHAHGSTLAVLRVARIVLVVAVACWARAAR